MCPPSAHLGDIMLNFDGFNNISYCVQVLTNVLWYDGSYRLQVLTNALWYDGSYCLQVLTNALWYDGYSLVRWFLLSASANKCSLVR